MAKLRNALAFSEIPGEQLASEQTITLSQFTEDLANAMRADGLVPPTSWDCSGRTMRFSSNGKRGDDSGWYAVHADQFPFFAVYGDWRLFGEKAKTFCERGRTTSDPLLQSRLEKERRERARMTEENREAAAKVAEAFFSEQAEKAKEDHPYLQKKKIAPMPLLKQKGNLLYVPMFDASGDRPTIASYQSINGRGDKRFLLNGRTSGCFCPVRGTFQVKSTDYIMLCEGMATAVSVEKASGYPTFMAFSAMNLPKVARVLEQLYPYSPIVVVADNDESGTGERYAKETGCRYILIPEVGKDANDYVNDGGDLAGLIRQELPKKRIVDIVDFLDGDYETPWIVEDWLVADTFNLVYGASGSGKTFFVLDLVMHIATGQKEWNGNRIRKALPCLYFAGEGQVGLKKRMNLWLADRGMEKSGAKGLMEIFEGQTDFDTPQGMSEVVQQIESSGVVPKVVVLDTLNRYMKGDENSAQESRAFINNCLALMERYGCIVIVVTHTGVAEDAQGRARGSSAWRGAADTEICVQKSQKFAGLVEVAQKKMKDAEMLEEPVYMKLEKKVIATDSYGKEITSCIVRYVDDTEGYGRDEKRDFEDQDREELEHILQICGYMEKGSVLIRQKDWKDDLRRRGNTTKYLDNFFSNAENRAIGRMLSKEHLLKRLGKPQEYYFRVLDMEMSSGFAKVWETLSEEERNARLGNSHALRESCESCESSSSVDT